MVRLHRGPTAHAGVLPAAFPDIGMPLPERTTAGTGNWRRGRELQSNTEHLGAFPAKLLFAFDSPDPSTGIW